MCCGTGVNLLRFTETGFFELSKAKFPFHQSRKLYEAVPKSQLTLVSPTRNFALLRNGRYWWHQQVLHCMETCARYQWNCKMLEIWLWGQRGRDVSHDIFMMLSHLYLQIHAKKNDKSAIFFFKYCVRMYNVHTTLSVVVLFCSVMLCPDIQKRLVHFLHILSQFSHSGHNHDNTAVCWQKVNCTCHFFGRTELVARLTLKWQWFSDLEFDQKHRFKQTVSRPFNGKMSIKGQSKRNSIVTSNSEVRRGRVLPTFFRSTGVPEEPWGRAIPIEFISNGVIKGCQPLTVVISTNLGGSESREPSVTCSEASPPLLPRPAWQRSIAPVWSSPPHRLRKVAGGKSVSCSESSPKLLLGPAKWRSSASRFSFLQCESLLRYWFAA